MTFVPRSAQLNTPPHEGQEASAPCLPRPTIGLRWRLEDAMTARVVDAVAIRRWAEKAAADSARLEHREVPAGHVRSVAVARFLESVRSKA